MSLGPLHLCLLWASSGREPLGEFSSWSFGLSHAADSARGAETCSRFVDIRVVSRPLSGLTLPPWAHGARKGVSRTVAAATPGVVFPETQR